MSSQNMLSFYEVVKVFISRSTHFIKSASNEAKACPQYVTIHLTHTHAVPLNPMDL